MGGYEHGAVIPIRYSAFYAADGQQLIWRKHHLSGQWRTRSMTQIWLKLYEGKVYHMCCPDCHKDFEKDPAKYAKAVAANPGEIWELSSGPSSRSNPMLQFPARPFPPGAKTDPVVLRTHRLSGLE